ncbi:MAG: thioredoxin [Verrucomicrobia bacterium]|nr:thioredoxin [Verrucomicrobiota bacterium]MDA1087531.1 thioredoxin [Verrucomicrobiota bacterium]
MAGEHVVEITADNWQGEVIDSKVPVVVDFWAEWCGPCRAIAPVLDEIATEKNGKLKIAKVNVDDNQDIAAEFKIRAIPTLLVMKGGAVQDQMTGAMNKSALLEKIDPHL